jgi:hypothetical protein
MNRWMVVGLVALVLSLAGMVTPVRAQADDAIAGRLGGTGADFTAKYGDPIDDVKAPGLNGATIRSYEVFGFAEVSAIVSGGDVIGLTLRPVVGDTWTAEAAATVLGDFGPDDADYNGRQSIGPSDAGFRTAAQGTSDALEDALDDDLYEDLDLGGDPGDFFVVYYQSPTPNFYVALTITLGTVGERDAIDLTSGAVPAEVAAEEPATEPEEDGSTGGVQPLNADELVYASQVTDILIDVAGASGRLGELFTNFQPADYFDLDWQIDVASQIIILQSSYDTALTIVPPPAFAEMHTYFLSSLEKYDQAGDLLIYGIDNLDATALEQAAILIESAAADIATANALLTQIREDRGI